jgi:hypothetical protein
MRAARIITVLAAVLTLGSCQVLEFIFGSVFPATVGLAKAQTDLSAQIDQNSASAFHLRVVQSGSNGYVIVIGNPGGTGTVAYVYDLNLSLKATLTSAAGDGVLVDGGGFIVVGSVEYDPATLSAQATPILNTLYSNGTGGGGDGVTVAGTTECINFNFTSGTSTLNYGNAAYPWTAAASIPVAFTGGINGLFIDAILDDGKAAGTLTVAVHQSSSSGKGTATCYFLTTAKSNYAAGGVPLTLLSTAPSLPNIVTGCIGFAQGSIIAYDGSAGRFLRVDPATGSVQASFYSGTDMSNTRLGYIVTGGYFYGFDTKTRMLTKYAAWW